MFVGRAAFDALIGAEERIENSTATARTSRLKIMQTRILDRLRPAVGAVAAKELRYLLQRRPLSNPPLSS